MREAELTLTSCLQIAKQFQASERHATQMEMHAHSSTSQGQEAVNTVDAYSLQNTHPGHNLQLPSSGPVPAKCFCCGLLGHKAKDPSCPARGKACNKCGKSGHFGRVCKSSLNLSTQKSHSSVYFMTSEYSNEFSDDEYHFTLGNSSRKVPVIINGQEVPMIVDSGATVNVLDYSSCALLSKRSPIRLESSCVRVYPYGARVPLPVKGSCTIPVSTESSKKSTYAEFVVAQNLESDCLLGKKTAIELSLLRVGPPTLNAKINCMSPPTSVDRILSRHSAVFEGIGKFLDTSYFFTQIPA